MGRVVHFEIRCADLDRADAVIASVNTIEIADLAETGRRVDEAGVERVVDPAEIPDVGTVAYFKDTEGNIFGALQPA
jgi:predicted enzyme related to lactoylglutathione lyase